MGLSCGASLIKYILFFVNFLLWIGSILIIVVGALILKGINDANLQADEISSIKVMGGIIVGLGSALFLTTFCGCCGAVTENRCLLIIYDIILIILCIALFGLAIATVVKKDKVLSVLNDDFFKKLMDAYGVSTDPTLIESSKITYDALQKNLQCCGSKDKDDWKETAWYKTASPKPDPAYPDSCKKTGSKDAYSQGCKQAVQDKLRSLMPIVYGVLFGIASIQLLIVLMVTYLIVKVAEANSLGKFSA